MNWKTVKLILAMVVITSGFIVCSIHDDAGNPVVTEETEQQEIPRITITPFTAVKSGDTLAITIFVWRDTVDTVPIANAPIGVSISDGWISASSITTGGSGYATVLFSDSLIALNEEVRTITFTYLSTKEAANIIISNETTVLQTHYMTISANPYIINADGVSQSAVTVKIKNEAFNPIAGETIVFSTNAGDITASSVTTAGGTATATLTSERRNKTALVTAILTSDTSKSATIEIEFNGIDISASADPSSIIPNGVDASIVTMTLLDAAGIAIYGEKVDFRSKSGNTAILTVLDTLTDTRGQAQCSVTGTGTGQDTIVIKAAGDSAAAVINYSSNYLVIKPADGSSLIANGTDSTLITVTYYAADQVTKIKDATLYVSVTSGTIDTLFTKVDITDDSGNVSFYIKNPDFATTATITATAVKAGEVTSQAYDLYFKANAISRIELNGSPEVISTGGDIATITATAFDSKDNRVKDAVISFKLASGPGAGEYLNPPTAVTDASGAAVSSLVSGSSPSTQQDVWVIASSFSGISSNVFKFTIAGPPAYVTFRKDVGDIIEYPDGTYGINCAALVTDINRNPVKEGTNVTFSLQITGFSIFSKVVYIDTLGFTAWRFEDSLLVFEDLNDNFINDPGETDHTGYPLLRGEDIVWFEGDRTYNPGPAFYDYNCNGRRDYNPNHYGYEPPETSFDFNDNGVIDTYEPLVDISISDTAYEAHPDFIHNISLLIGGNDTSAFGYPDMDWNNNGVPDPATTVIVTKNVDTEEGKAVNQIVYGQSDAWRIRVKIWVESQGVTSQSPEEFLLPISISDAPYYDYYGGKKYY